jgi:hypothetical protein
VAVVDEPHPAKVNIKETINNKDIIFFMIFSPLFNF